MESQSAQLPYEELFQRYQALIKEKERHQARENAIWVLMVETSRRLQAYSASIKAAVSSLLDYDIFWDSSNQHEFLETINQSSDSSSQLIMLLALSFRMEAGLLELKPEPQALQEILSVVQDRLPRKNNQILTFKPPADGGQAVFVDYEYLILALKLVFDSIEAAGMTPVEVEAHEVGQVWQLDLVGADPSIISLVLNIPCYRPEDLASLSSLPPEKLLGLYAACHILDLQNIHSSVVQLPSKPDALRFEIPVVAATLLPGGQNSGKEI